MAGDELRQDSVILFSGPPDFAKTLMAATLTAEPL